MNAARRVSLVINAGGASRRMGRDKALLPVPPRDTPLICHVAQRLRTLPLERLVVVANSCAVQRAIAAAPHGAAPVTIRRDAYPGTGALGGLVTGLAACDGWAIVVACDMPLLNPVLLRALWDMAIESTGAIDGNTAAQVDAVVPHVNGRSQPFHALYHRRCVPVMEAQLQAGERRVRTVLTQLRVRAVSEAELRRFDPDLLSFFNVNTPADWAQALHHLA